MWSLRYLEGDESHEVKITAAVAILGAGLGVATGCGTTRTVTTPGPAIIKTVQVPGPTITKTVKVPVPGPTVTKTKTVQLPAPPPPVGSTLGTWSGSGNEVTPAFYAPSTGDYIVSWQYSGNVDNSFGSSQATNFSISPTDSNAFGGNLPNDIAASGSGSTEITGVTAQAVESFNVQAAGQWTIKVVSAP